MNDNVENVDDNGLDDDSFRQMLRDAPVRPPRQLHGIRTRARAIRAHRQALTFSGVVAGVFVIAGAVATATVPFDRVEFGPAKSTEPEFVVDCSGDDEVRTDAAWSQLKDIPVQVTDPYNVPDDVRWLWAENTAPDPMFADASDNGDRTRAYEGLYRDCAPVAGESVVLTSASDDGTFIWRTVYLERVPEPAVDGRTNEGGFVEQFQVDDTTVTIHTRGKLNAESNYWSRLTASWHDGENTWYIAAEPLRYDQLRELVKKLRFVKGEIDLSAWSIANDSEFVDRGVSKFHSSHAESASFMVESETAYLMVHNQPQSMWLGAGAGSKLAEVNGRTAVIQKDGGGIRWQPENGITLELFSYENLARRELIELAESVTRVPPDDPRLTDDIWAR